MDLTFDRLTYEVLKRRTEEHNLDFYIVCGLIQQESGWNPSAKGDYWTGGYHAFGLMQISPPAAQDAGWAGTDTDELLRVDLNIILGCHYLSLCRNWAHYYGEEWVGAYGETECMLAVYNQGPGNYQDRGVYVWNEYIVPIFRYADNYREGAIIVDGQVEVEPPPGGTGGGGGGTTPPPPDDTGVIETIDRWTETVRKTQKKEQASRQYPPGQEYHSDIARFIAGIAAVLKSIRLTFENWLYRIDKYP